MSDRRYMIVMYSALAVVLLWAVFGLVNTGGTDEKYPISVVIGESNNDRWIALKQGMEQAAEDYGVDLTIVPTNALYTISSELDLIDKEIEEGAAGIVTAPVSSEGFTEMMEKNGNLVSFAFLDSDIMPEGRYPSVTANNTDVGNALCDALKSYLGYDLSGKRIAIAHFYRQRSSSRTRYEILNQGLMDAGAKVTVLSEDPERMQSELAALLGAGMVDGVVALNSIELEMSIDALLEAGVGGTIPLVGLGYSEKNVYYLDKGVVREIVLPNDFNVGYLSIQSCYFALTEKLSATPGHVVEVYRVTRENMYDEDMEKILFPLAK